MTYRKKLIEVALPLDAINRACRPETENPFLAGHPRALHVYWARSPLVTCRAIIFASLVDDPEQEGVPKELLNAIDALPSPLQSVAEAVGSVRRAKLFQLMEELIKWENTANEILLEMARNIIRASTGGNPPPLLDPFCGRGSIPLEAQRLGLEAYASDLNPVAVLITKALIEIPAKFAGCPPVNPDAKRSTGSTAAWKGTAGLAADVRYYGKWICDRACECIGHLYPKGPNGETIIAWLWARTVKCPNPACGAQMPLVRSFRLSTKKGKEAWVEPLVDKQAKTVRFTVKANGKPLVDGTMTRTGTTCLICRAPAPLDHIRTQAQAGRMGQQLMALVAEGQRSRIYLAPSDSHEVIATSAVPTWKPEQRIPSPNHDVDRLPMYGMYTWGDAFSARQLTALVTFSDLLQQAKDKVLEHSGGDVEYANAVVTYLALAVSRLTDYHATLCTWNPTNENVRNVFVRQAIPMVWDFAEANPINGKLNMEAASRWVAAALNSVSLVRTQSRASQLDTTQALPDTPSAPLVCTDPPYYDNIGYADLTDFFYVWLRRCMGKVYPDLFSTLLTPKQAELVATPYRFGGDRNKADTHFEEGMAKAFVLMRKRANLDYPVTIYYAFKQEEAESHGLAVGRVSTGWEKMLSGLLGAGYQVTGTWPMRTTKAARAVARNANALASAVVLVCRPRPEDASIATRREFLSSLRKELPDRLKVLMNGRVAPVDLAQATIGPGMAVFSRYSKVLEADGSVMTVRTALQEINYFLYDSLAQQEGDLDPESQFCIIWFEQFGVKDSPYGEADNLARAKNIGVDNLVRLGLVDASRGKVRLKLREDYEDGWDPQAQSRLTAWEACQRLVWTLNENGEQAAGRLARRLGGLADQARELAYRLYGIADRKGWAEEALGYNALVASWPEIQKAAAAAAEDAQGRLV